MNSTWLDDDEWTGGERRPADRSGADAGVPGPPAQSDESPNTDDGSAAEPAAQQAPPDHDGGAWPAAASSPWVQSGSWGAPGGSSSGQTGWGAPAPAPTWQPAPPTPQGYLSHPGQPGQPLQPGHPLQTTPTATPPTDPTTPPPVGGDWSSAPEPTDGSASRAPADPSRDTDPAREVTADDRGSRDDTAGRGTGRTAVVAALVGALVAVAVAVPTTLALAPDAADQAANAPVTPVNAPQDTPQDETPVAPAAPPASMTTDTVADVAEALLPSVAVVETNTGSGSAVVYRADGFLITNNHVIAGARDVRVRLTDGRTRDATVVGTAASFDLAVLQIDADDLMVPEYADGDPRVGETAIAIGAPFGFDSTVTSGIVSALGRTLSDPISNVSLVDLVQTDAAINPGNSGGALVNAAGQVIGINTAIVGGGTNDGVGFAVPTSTVLRVADQLIEQGFFEYALLGVTGGDLQPAQAEELGLETTNGAYIGEVVPDSAADDAGIVPGDVVVAIDGDDVTSMSDLSAAIRGYGPDDVVTVTLYGADGRTREVEVTLGGVRTND